MLNKNSHSCKDKHPGTAVVGWEDQPEGFSHRRSPLLVWSHHKILFLPLGAELSALPSRPESLRNNQDQVPQTFHRS